VAILTKGKGILQGTFRKWIVCLAIFISGSPTVFSQISESDIKAMFLFNFIKYVEWPQTQGVTGFKIGVVGKSQVFESLQKVIAQKTKDGHKIELVSLSEKEFSSCQLVFISRSAESSGEEWARTYQGSGVLVVSEESTRSGKWAAINLVTIENKIRFEINQSAAKAGGIKISSQLSSLAVSINP
jgi:hypothetical protein